MEGLKMLLLRGMYRGRIGERKGLTTKTVHIARKENDNFTICGVNAFQSEILGTPVNGEFEEVNCKRCLKSS
jgi:hypothetical protein